MSVRPKNLHPSRSFTRLETAPKSPLSRSRASTLQSAHTSDMLDPLKANIVPEEDESPGEKKEGDIFAPSTDHDCDDNDSHLNTSEAGALDSFEELPIEIRSLTERYAILLSC